MAPSWCEWLNQGRVERLFFVRYSLGGPHVRIRGEWSAADDSLPFEAELEQWTHRYFADSPPRSSRSREWIAQVSAELQATDPTALDATAQPDGSLVATEYLPEESRYGGRTWMPCNHELFYLSSLSALDRIRRGAAERPGRLETLALVLKLLMASAHEPGDLEALSRYPPDTAKRRHQGLIQEADRLLEQQPQLFEAALAAALESSTGPERRPEDLLAQGLARFSPQLPPSERRRILSSHVHMTLNRLGVNNREELLLLHWASRLVDRFDMDSADRLAASPRPEDSAASTLASLQQLSREALQALAASTHPTAG